MDRLIPGIAQSFPGMDRVLPGNHSVTSLGMDEIIPVPDRVPLSAGFHISYGN